MGLPVSHLNKGRMDLILTCTWRYWKQYADDSPDEGVFWGKGAAFLGSALHKALEDFYEMNDMSKKNLLKHYDLMNENGFDETLFKVEVDQWKAEPLAAGQYIEGREILDKWFDNVYANYLEENRTNLGNEVQFGYSPRHDKGDEMLVAGVPIHGFIDRVDEVILESPKGNRRILEVVDYKSNRMPKPRTEIDDPYNAEVNIYLIAARKLYPGYDEYRFIYDFLRHGIYSTTRERDELKNYLRFMKRVHAYAINLETPTQDIGPSCGYCPYKGECESLQSVIEKGLKPPSNEANFDNLEDLAREHSKIANAAKALYGRKAQIEETIKNLLWSNDMMSYQGENVSVNLRASRSSSFDTRTVVEELKDDPDTLAEVINVGKGKLEKKMKDMPVETRDRLYRTMKRGHQNPSLNINLTPKVED